MEIMTKIRRVGVWIFLLGVLAGSLVCLPSREAFALEWIPPEVGPWKYTLCQTLLYVYLYRKECEIWEEGKWVVQGYGSFRCENKRLPMPWSDEGLLLEKAKAFYGDPDGTLRRAIHRTFDLYDHLDTQTLADGRQDDDYDALGRLVRHPDEVGVVTTLRYDARGRLVSLTRDADGQAPALTAYQYDPQDHAVLIAAPNQAETARSYDDLGHRVSEDSADTGHTTDRFDPAGNLVERVDANGDALSLVYDPANRLLSLQGPSPADDVRYVYDDCVGGLGKLCRIETGDPGNPVSVGYRYNAFGDVVAHQGLSYAYDSAGRLRTLTYPSGAVVTYHRNGTGRIDRVELQYSGQTLLLADQIQYAPFGPVTGLVYGNGLTLDQPLNLAYRPRRLVIPGVLQWETIAYDGRGEVTPIEDSLGGVHHYRYDALARLIEASGPFGTQTFSYDANGNRLWEIHDGVEIDYEYELASNRLTRAANEPVTLDPGGNTLARGGRGIHYDSHHRLVAVDGRQPVRYRYNGLGQRIEKKIGIGAADDAARASGLRARAGQLRAQAQRFQVRAKALERQGERLKKSARRSQSLIFWMKRQADRAEARSRRQRAWQRRVLHRAAFIEVWLRRLLERLSPWTAPLQHRLQTWRERGSRHARLTAARHGMRAARLLRWAHSLRRRVSARQQRAEILGRRAQQAHAQATRLRQQAAQQLAQADQLQAQADTLAQKAQHPGRITRYRYDLQGHLVAELDAQDHPLDEIIYLEDHPLALLRQGKVYYLHTDHLGTPRAVTDSQGEVLWRWDSDPFGATLPDQDPDGDGIPFIFNLRFPGQYYDQETGLHYNYFRYYDPSTGRYLTSDPIGLAGGLNTYAYVGENPINFIDPTGKFLGTLAGKVLRRVTGQTAQEVAVGGKVADAALSGALTAGGTNIPGRNGPLGLVIDSAQAFGGAQTVGLSTAIAFSIGGVGATVSSVGAITLLPGTLAALGGAEIGLAFNSIFEQLAGDSPGAFVFELINAKPCQQ